MNHLQGYAITCDRRGCKSGATVLGQNIHTARVAAARGRWTTNGRTDALESWRCPRCPPERKHLPHDIPPEHQGV